MIVHGTLKPDDSLELDHQPNLSPGRVRVIVEAVVEPSLPDRFGSMMDRIWTDLRAIGHMPRSVEEIEAERRAFRGRSGQDFVHHCRTFDAG